MRKILVILILVGTTGSSFACCDGDDRTLTELLFNGKAGTIFTCKILTASILPTNWIDKSGMEMSMQCSSGCQKATETAQIITVYFGKVDTDIVTLYAYTLFPVGTTWLIYAGGDGKAFGCGGKCDRWTKEVPNNPETLSEVQTIKQFSEIIKMKKSGNYSFKNEKGTVIGGGSFKNGNPVGLWKHYDNKGKIHAKYNFKGKTVDYTLYSKMKSGHILHHETKTTADSIITLKQTDYDENGKLRGKYGCTYFKKRGSNQCSGEVFFGRYEEYYDGGAPRTIGRYAHAKKVGKWKEYNAVGDLKVTKYKHGVAINQP
jgi:antitoxin component YwqK of YwqJK toxin-antitoxin module